MSWYAAAARAVSVYLPKPGLYFTAVLAKENRLNTTQDFQQVFLRGKTLRDGPITIKYFKKTTGAGRFAFVVPGALSKKSVIRNKIRRRLRYIIRSVVPPPYPSFDVIVFAYKGAQELPFSELKILMCSLLERAHIYVHKEKRI